MSMVVPNVSTPGRTGPHQLGIKHTSSANAKIRISRYPQFYGGGVVKELIRGLFLLDCVSVWTVPSGSPCCVPAWLSIE